MSMRKVFPALAALLLLLAGGILWFSRPVPVVMTVDVTGTPGLPIRGTREVDGKTGAIEGTIPMHFTLEGDSLAFAIDSGAGSGTFQVRLEAVFNSGPLQGEAKAETSGAAPDSVVRGSAMSGWAWNGPQFGIRSANEKAWTGPAR